MSKLQAQGFIPCPERAEALRAWLLSACPSGTKAILPFEAPQDYLSAYAADPLGSIQHVVLLTL